MERNACHSKIPSVRMQERPIIALQNAPQSSSLKSQVSVDKCQSEIPVGVGGSCKSDPMADRWGCKLPASKVKQAKSQVPKPTPKRSQRLLARSSQRGSQAAVSPNRMHSEQRKLDAHVRTCNDPLGKLILLHASDRQPSQHHNMSVNAKITWLSASNI